MSDPRHPVPEMDAFREQLRAAAAREQEAPGAPSPEPPRRRRRRLRGGRGLAVALAALLVGGGTVAVATSVISVGKEEEFPNRFTAEDRELPLDGEQRTIVARASDPEQRLQWGVAAAKGEDGKTCMVAGQVRGNQIGRVVGDEFRPYPADTPTVCVAAPDYSLRTTAIDTLGDPKRYLYYGMAGADVATVRIVVDDGERITVPVRKSGFLLVVLEADAKIVEAKTYDAAGRHIG